MCQKYLMLGCCEVEDIAGRWSEQTSMWITQYQTTFRLLDRENVLCSNIHGLEPSQIVIPRVLWGEGLRAYPNIEDDSREPITITNLVLEIKQPMWCYLILDRWYVSSQGVNIVKINIGKLWMLIQRNVLRKIYHRVIWFTMGQNKTN